MREVPKAGEKYRHFKGKEYEVIAIAKDCEDITKEVVVYRALYGDNSVYIRKLEDFCSVVDRDKYPNVEQQYRFERIQ